MPHFIKKLIDEGEHQRLDFKFEISDFSKIARSLVAFANTDGGRLLVGVKDNGAIAGIRSDEEFYMVDGAAKIYCRPEVKFDTKEWKIEGKKVLEIIIAPSKQKPHYASDKEGRWKAFIRQDDQNLPANKVLLKVWKRQEKGKGTFISYTEKEKLLLEHLTQHESITLSAFQQLAGISRHRAETILVNFIMLEIVEMKISEKATHYRLRKDYLQQDIGR